jgi:excinuclease ABC subunit C
MTPEVFRKIAPTIPHQPGVYKYYNADNEIIYVGKAKDLRKRVSSYFNKTFVGYKTHELVLRIERIEFTIVDTEQDALFLENSLIKQYKPRYNIDLKDDKSYPYIVIKKEPFPRVFLTRRKIEDGSEYLGPFTSVARVRELLSFIRMHIPLRTCKLPLTTRSIAQKKFRLCLEYHLGNCRGPCVGFQTEAEYQQDLARMRQVLKGKLGEVMQHYQQEMAGYVNNLEFEKAQRVKMKIDHLEKYQARSVVVSQQLGELDVFSLLQEADLAFVNYLMVRNGSIVQTHNLQLSPRLDESPAEVLAFGIEHLRETFGSDAPEIVVPMELEYAIPGCTQTIPKAGDKKKLLELSEKNVGLFRQELMQKRLLHAEGKTEEELLDVLEEMQTHLQLAELPVHIECFDNSNFQGSFPVSAMVCFRNGMPSKNDYRRFHVKTVKGINDFATMKEVVFRRYKKLADQHEALPQLVIIDGGKGQLSAALEAIDELGLSGQLTLVGLAKNVEELFFAGDSQSVKLPWNSEPLRLIRRIRDEVHRFGITFHRNTRSKGTFRNELESIAGIGKQTATQLLQTFRSVKKVKEASESELAKVVGPAKAKLLTTFFASPASY